MKVTAINGIPRKDGNTAILLTAVLQELQKQNIQTELIQLGDTPLALCKGCFACKGMSN